MRREQITNLQAFKPRGPTMGFLIWQHAEDNSCRRRSPRDGPADGGVLLRGTVSWGPICLHTPTSHRALSSEEVNLELCNSQPHQNDSTEARSFVTFITSCQISSVTPCSVYSARTSLPLSAKPSDSALALTVNLDSFQTGIVKCNKPPASAIPLQ